MAAGGLPDFFSLGPMQDADPETLALMAYAREAALREGLDPRIFHKQITQESGWNPRAGSPVGAQGIAQIMPQYHPGVDPWDPHASLDYAARLMRSHLDRFGGDCTKALAAYNAGAGAVEKYGGVPPYAETQTYVKNILGDNGNYGLPTTEEQGPSSLDLTTGFGPDYQEPQLPTPSPGPAPSPAPYGPPYLNYPQPGPGHFPIGPRSSTPGLQDYLNMLTPSEPPPVPGPGAGLGESVNYALNAIPGGNELAGLGVGVGGFIRKMGHVPTKLTPEFMQYAKFPERLFTQLRLPWLQSAMNNVIRDTPEISAGVHELRPVPSDISEYMPYLDTPYIGIGTRPSIDNYREYWNAGRGIANLSQTLRHEGLHALDRAAGSAYEHLLPPYINEAPMLSDALEYGHGHSLPILNGMADTGPMIFLSPQSQEFYEAIIHDYPELANPAFITSLFDRVEQLRRFYDSASAIASPRMRPTFYHPTETIATMFEDPHTFRRSGPYRDLVEMMRDAVRRDLVKKALGAPPYDLPTPSRFAPSLLDFLGP